MAIAAVGLLLLFWILSPGRRERTADVARLALGDSRERVTEVMGAPLARCPGGGDLSHLAPGFPPGWPGASRATTLQTLGEETAERWVYPLRERSVIGCTPVDGQSEFGFDQRGRLLWYITFVGESPLRFSERFTPAAPTD